MITLAVLAALVGGGLLGIRSLVRSGPDQAQPGCRAAIGPTGYPLDLEQAASASTIAAIGKRLAMPDHAVTIALATSLQESGLHNLDHGDRDSVGLFQQRPSQGWGSVGQIMVPRYAATAFYQRLVRLPSWQTLSVAEAAQAVQHSGAPTAYANWEPEARVLAQVMTGETAEGLSCTYPDPVKTGTSRLITQGIADDVGPPGVDKVIPPAQGWTLAAWLVGHGHLLGIRSVSFAGMTWRPAGGGWMPGTAAPGAVHADTRPCCGG